MKAALNDFVSGRGTSGSAVGGGAIRRALQASSIEIETVTPGGYVSGNRLRNATGMLAWDFALAARSSHRIRADAMINLANTGLGWSIPTINVLHDTMVLDHPNMFDAGYRAYAKLAFGASVRSASLNVTPSQHSKRQALRRWPDARIAVVPWTSAVSRTDAPPQKWESLNVLSIASSDRHKRIPMLIDAVKSLREITNWDFSLTLVSRKGNDHSRLAQYARSAGLPWLRIESNYISSGALKALIDSSFCMAASSLDEGFCLPLLEACLRGVPVVHTSRGAMSEVVEPNSEVRRPTGPSGDRDFLVAQFVQLVNETTWRDEASRAWKRSSHSSPSEFKHSWAELLQEVASAQGR